MLFVAAFDLPVEFVLVLTFLLSVIKVRLNWVKPVWTRIRDCQVVLVFFSLAREVKLFIRFVVQITKLVSLLGLFVISHIAVRQLGRRIVLCGYFGDGLGWGFVRAVVCLFVSTLRILAAGRIDRCRLLLLCLQVRLFFFLLVRCLIV